MGVLRIFPAKLGAKVKLERYKKDGVKELDEDKLGKLVDLSGLGSVREVANNFGGIPKMRDEYFELQKEIYKG